MEPQPKHHTLLVVGIALSIIIVFALTVFIVYKELQRRNLEDTVTRTNNKYELLNMANAEKGSQLQKDLTGRIIQISQPGSTIRLENNCEAYPLVVQTKLNSTITIENNASISQTVTVQGTKYPIDAHQKKAIKTNFSQGTGVYGYKCVETNDLPVNGYIYLTP